jgi:probable phosphoglycerate mutase
MLADFGAQDSASMRLIAIRHGETEWNVLAREMGQLDSPLTERGVDQAKALAARLGKRSLAAIYSSDLGRAVQTAHIISAMAGVEVFPKSELRERHMGIFQGLTSAEMEQRFPTEYSSYRRDPHHFQIPQGESGRQRLERSVQCLTAIAERHAEGTVVVVTHGGFLMGFFEHVLGMPPGNGWRFKKQNAAYNCFEYANGRWSLETWNDTTHFDGLGSLDDTAVPK